MSRTVISHIAAVCASNLWNFCVIFFIIKEGDMMTTPTEPEKQRRT